MKFEVPRVPPSAELEAKAALLRHLSSTGLLRPRGAVAVELTVGRQANRADIVVVDDRVRCFEVKSKRDTLTRLDQQMRAFSYVFDEVIVVAATRHINAALSRVQDHIGIWEMVEFGDGIQIREVRPPASSPAIDIGRMLDLLPVADMRKAFKLAIGSSAARRNDLIEQAGQLPLAVVRNALRSFLLRRYGPSTSRFRRAVDRRDITVADLERLKVWGANSNRTRAEIQEPSASIGSDWALFNYVGAGFGPVPDDIRALLVQDC